MVYSPWKGWFMLERETYIGRFSHRRPLTRLSPQCEALDPRQLLSSVPVGAAEFIVPPAASVRKAASILESKAPAAFAQFQTALAQAEKHSNLDQADVSALAQDEAVVVQDIESAGLAKSTSTFDLRYVEDAVDFALSGSPGIHVGQSFVPLPQVSQRLDSQLYNVPAVLASSSPTSISPIDQLIDQVMVVAKNARPAPAMQAALNRSYNRLSDAFGRTAITNLGPGETGRDVLVVYYDGQVNKFVK
jgi:hypothetical protein